MQLLNTGQVDAIAGTITIPLYKGTVKSTGKTAWYILTDVSDQGVAEELGLNFSAKLNFINSAARTGNLDANGNIVFDKGTVNFAPIRNIVAGPDGSGISSQVRHARRESGDTNYSPFVSITNAQGVIYNAPMVAYDVDASQINFPNGNVDYTKVHDQVVAIDPVNMTVTLNLINGFSFGRPVWYISMDASNTLAAAIEHNTYAPLMDKLLLGDDDSFASPIERIFIATNGTGRVRQSSASRAVSRPGGWSQAEQYSGRDSDDRSRLQPRMGRASCTRGLTRLFPRAIASNFVKSSRFSPTRKTA